MPDELTQEDDALAIRLGQIADQFTEAVARGERPDVESFARQHPEVASLLRQVLPAIEAMRAAAPPAFAVPQVLGDFRLLREVGRGGMGIVYEAEQLSFPRKVALKLLPVHPALDAKYLARFEREARTAATLHHTNIVPVYAVGHEAGVHYYAMQFIDGPGLDQLLQQWRAGSVSNSPALAARIGMQVAEALDYAHGRGIVHRDIKPSNILLQLEARSAIRDPQSAIPKITDFGLVKHLDETDNLTRTGDLVGTARYMSPEQTSTKRGPVDGRTDVYSLGVTLYELLTLQPAFDGDHAAVLQQVANVEPIAPRQRDRSVPRDLETIVLKAMAKSPADRYRTAGELAAELRRFLAGEPIQARPLGALERGRRWCKRNPIVAGLTGAVALSLLIGSVVSTYFAIQAVDRAAEAIRERDRAEANEERVRQEKRLADRHLYVAQMNLVQQGWERGHIARVLQLLQGLEPTPGAEDPRGFDWHYFERMCQPARLRWPAHEHAVSCLAYTPDGRGLASGGHDGLIHLWDAAGKAVQTCRGHRGRIRGIAFSADGKSLASASHDRTVKLWDVASGKETRTIALDEPVLCVAWAANGRLACGTAQNNLHLFDGEKQQTLPLAEAVRAVTFSADSKFLAASAGRLVHVLNGQDLEKLHALAGPDGDVRVLAFSPDGLTLAGAGYDPTIRLWDVTTGQEKAKLPGHHDPVSGLAFSPDGQTLASGEGDPSHLFLPKEELKSRPGGARARPGEIKLWDLATKLERASLRRHSGPVYCLAYRPDGQELASAGDDMSIVIWDVSGRERTQLPGHTREVNAVAVSPDGKLLASVSDDRDLRLWDIATGQSVDVLRPSGNIKAVAFAPDGATIAIGGGDKLIWLIATESRQSMGTLKGHAGTIRSIVYSSDGRRLVTAAGDPYQKPPRPGEIKLWDTASGELLADLKGHADVVRGVAVSPDGRWAASGSDDRSVKVWDLDARREVTTLTLAEGVRSVAFSPDSATLAIAGGDGLQTKPSEVILWDVKSRARRAVLEGHRATVLAVVFAPDGQCLATGSSDGTVRLWDAVTGQERALLEGHRGSVRALAFAPDGKVLATGDNEAMVRLWFGKR